MTVRLRLLLSCVLALVLLATAASPGLAGGRVYRHRLLADINQVRAEHGRVPLRASHGVHVAAQRHSADLRARDYFAHPSPTGSTLPRRIVTSGFVYWGDWWAG